MTAGAERDSRPAALALWGDEEHVRVDGLALRVVRRGEGLPLLLMNGIGATAEMWAPLVGHLDGRELIAVDLPGTGSSPISWPPLRIRAIAQLVAGLLDALGRERVDVLGYSFGGIVAQELAMRAPERVERVVLCATSAGIGSVLPNPLPLMVMLTPARYTRPAEALQIVPVVAGGRTSRDPEALHPDLRMRLINPSSAWGYLSQLYAVSGWSSLPWLRCVEHPTLVIHGDDDPLVPFVNAQTIAELMPNARLLVAPDAGHLLLLDEPESVAGEIEAFLSERAPARAGPR
jgi:poly(3-hydroxyalkanoate) depolymerase